MMDRSSGCGPCPWSCSGKVGTYDAFSILQLHTEWDDIIGHFSF